MKNELLLTNPNTIKVYVNSLWQSDLFIQASRDFYSFVYALVSKLSKNPVLFYDFSEPEIEKPHFTAWFRCIAHRTYDNPVIHDLYLYHELFHAVTLLDRAQLRNTCSRTSWAEQMIENELFASLESEVFVYIRMPELRKKSFEFEIWYDGIRALPFVANEISKYEESLKGYDIYTCVDDLYRVQSPYLFYLQHHRSAALTLSKPDNPVHARMVEYAKQDQAWVEIWKNNARNVENFLFNFNKLGGHRRSGLMQGALLMKFLMQGFRSNAIHSFVESKEEPEIQASMRDEFEINGIGVPFRKEAKEFSDIYNQMLV